MPSGILAFWGTLPAARAADFEDWYNRQHLHERSDLPGFVSGQRYRSGRRFFAWYETRSPDVLSSPAYLARLAKPTAWTRRVMPHVQDAVRAIFRVGARVGRGRGAVAAVIDGTLPTAHLRGLLKHPGVLGAWQWLPVEAPRVTTESKLRPAPDRGAGAMVLVEAADVGCLREALAAEKLRGRTYPLRYIVAPSAI